MDRENSGDSAERSSLRAADGVDEGISQKVFDELFKDHLSRNDFGPRKDESEKSLTDTLPKLEIEDSLSKTDGNKKTGLESVLNPHPSDPLGPVNKETGPLPSEHPTNPDHKDRTKVSELPSEHPRNPDHKDKTKVSEPTIRTQLEQGGESHPQNPEHKDKTKVQPPIDVYRRWYPISDRP